MASLLLLGGLFAGVALWSVGLIRFARSIPDDVVDASTATDAIVVLTGGSERLATGLRLLAEQKGKRVFISGVHPGVPVSDLLRVAGASSSSTDPRIEMGHGARDTAGNAEETASWLRERGYTSLRLVTGSYHMPRSLLEFEHALPEARVIPNPVFPPRVHQDAWWRSPGTATLIITEYNKYLLAIARQRLGLPSPAALWSARSSFASTCTDTLRAETRQANQAHDATGGPAARSETDYVADQFSDGIRPAGSRVGERDGSPENTRAAPAGGSDKDGLSSEPARKEQSREQLWFEVRRTSAFWLGRC